MIDCLMLVMMLFVGIGLRKVSFSELGLWWWSRPQGMDLLVRVWTWSVLTGQRCMA